MKNVKSQAGKGKLTNATLEKLVESIDKESERKAKEKWERLLGALHKLKDEMGITFEIIETGAWKLADNSSKPPQELVEIERQAIIKTVITGCPF